MTALPTRYLDRNDTGALLDVLTEVVRAGQLYRNGESVIYFDQDLGAVRVLDPEKLGTGLESMGLVELVNANGEPVPVASRGGYLTSLDRLLTRPGLLTLPCISGVYRRPCLVERTGCGLVPAPAGLHQEVLYTGESVNTHTSDAKEGVYAHLRTWLTGMDFLSETHRANLLGYVLACFARPALREFPFLVIDGTDRKVGKTTVARAVARLITGTEPEPVTHTGDEHEFEKRLGHVVGKPGPNVVYIDNIRPKRGQTGSIRSQFLAVAATSPYACIRRPYSRQPEPVYYPIIVLTMNRAVVESDLHDRVVRVILAGKSGRYFDPNPDAFVNEHRPAMVREALHLLMSLPSRPGTFKPATRFRDFEYIGREACSLLGMRADYQPDAVDTADGFVKELHAVYRNLGEGPRKLLEVVEHIEMNQPLLPELVAYFRQCRSTNDHARVRDLSEAVRRLAGRELYVDGKVVKFKLDDAKLEVI